MAADFSAASIAASSSSSTTLSSTLITSAVAGFDRAVLVAMLQELMMIMMIFSWLCVQIRFFNQYL
jgi:hypothetical protein